MLFGGSALLAAAPPGTVRDYRDGAPPGFSGGFGEDSCRACHFEAELNEAPGSLLLSGVPVSWEPGAVYPLTVALARPGIALGGFQLTARFEDGGQAGSLAAGERDATRVAVAVKSDTGVQYAHQSAAGAVRVAPGLARWRVSWTAPPSNAAAVLFHVAANAADDDESASGDFVYTTAAASLPR